MHQRHSTPIRPSIRGANQTSNPLSISVPDNNSYHVTSGSTTCWGSLNGGSNVNNDLCQTPQTRVSNLKKLYQTRHNYNDNLSSHQQQIMQKKNLIKFYEKKAAELVAHTVDTAAKRCQSHFLWQKLSEELDPLVNNLF